MTDRLHALDAVWRELEGDGPSIAIGTVAVADGPTPSTLEVAALITARLDRMPRMREVLRPPRIGLRRSSWVPADDLDVTAHVHPMRVDPGQEPVRPGSLGDAVSRIMEWRLPDDRPLWDAWVVDLPGPRWALVWRVHHTIADGLGALALLGHGFDTQADGGPTLAEAVLAGRSQPRGWGEQASGGDAGGGGGLLGSVTGAVGGAVGAARSLLPHVRASASSLAPHRPSTLTGPVGSRRRWVPIDLPLADVKAARRAFGVTVNDVVLACVCGGFRVLLEHRRELLDGRTVRNLVPVAMAPAADGHTGNAVSGLLGHLPVGEQDPVARLHQVAAAVGHGKHAQQPATLSMLVDLADRTVPAAVQRVVVSTVGRVAPAVFIDTLTTNVPGPPFPVFVLGRPVTAMYPVIPVAGHTAITTGIFSYDGTLHVGVTGDGELAPDVDVLAEGIRASAAEYAALAAASVD